MVSIPAEGLRVSLILKGQNKMLGLVNVEPSMPWLVSPNDDLLKLGISNQKWSEKGKAKNVSS